LLAALDSLLMKEPSSPQSKSLLDTHAPDRPEVEQLSETEKNQLELSGQAEHEQGKKREAANEQAEAMDPGKSAN
jgi:hypothetical protein